MDRNIVMLYAVNFCIAIAFGLFFFLPAFIGSMGRPEYIAGTLISSAGVGAIVSIFLSQHLIKKFSSKALIMSAFILYATGSLFYAISTHYSDWFYLYSFLVGCGWGLSYNVLPYQLSLLISNKAKIARFFNVYSAFGVLGTSLGPIAVHFFLKNLQAAWSMIFFMAMGFAILALIFCCFIGFKNDVPHYPAEKATLPAMIFLPWAIIFVNACVYTTLVNFQINYTAKLHISYFLFYLLYGLTVIGSRFFIAPIVDRLEHFKLVVGLNCIMCLSILLFLFSGNGLIFYLAASILFGIGYGMCYPFLQVIVINLASAQLRYKVITYSTLCYFVAIYGFPSISGLFLSYGGFSESMLFLLSVSAISLALSIVCLNKRRPS